MAAAVPRRRSAAGGVFVGRAWELEQLRAALRDAQLGRGQLFVVTGEAGIGKTRLVGELAARAEEEGAQVLWGRCWEGEEAPAFWPWVQIFRSLGFALEPGVEVLGVPASNAARFRLFDAAVTAIGEAAATRPLVLILEDLHEADRSSLLLLEFLVRQLHGMALLLLATCREPESGLTPAVREALAHLAPRGHLVTLAGLRREEVAEFLGQGFATVLPDGALSAVHEGTGGNPFFLDDLARRFVGEGRLPEAPGGGLEVPEGLKAPVRSRVASISAGARALLATASVIGREFSFDVLVTAAGLTEGQVQAALGELTAARLVEPAGFGLGPQRFVHALVRETIYQDLPTAERCRLHGAVARAIESRHATSVERHLDHLAHHFSQAAGLGDAGPAIRYSRQAGERAARQFGYDEAVGHFRRALDLAGNAGAPAEERFGILLALGDALWWAGYATQAGQTFEAAAALAREMGDAHRLAEAALRVGEVGYGGAYAQAWWFDAGKARLLDEALRALGDEETPLGVRVAARLSTALYFSPFESLARRDLLSREAVALARRLGDDAALGYALNARHLAVWAPDNLDERLALAAEIVELALVSGDVLLELTGRVWCLADLLELGDVAGADREIETYAALAEDVGYPHFVAYSFMFRALQAIMRGDFADAEAFAERSRSLGEQVGDANIGLSHHVQVASLRVFQGRPAEAAGHLDYVARQHPPQLGKVVTLAFRWVAGEAAAGGAFRSVARALRDIPPAFLLGMGSAMALLSAEAGSSREAADLYDVLRPYEQRWALAGRDAVVSMWPVAYPLGVLAASLSRVDAAAGHFDAAIEAAEGAGCRPSVALAKVAYGAMLARVGGDAGRERAARLLDDAFAAATELGMPQVRAQALAARARLPRPAGGGDGPVQPVAEVPCSGVFRVEGDFWTIDYGGLVVRMKDAKGFRYLRRLLAAPGREFHVLDLAAGAPARPAGAGRGEICPVDGTDPVLDAQAKAAFRARIEELSRDQEEAEADNDLGRASRARTEIDFLVAELSRALGLGGRDRPVVGSPAERARSSVGKSLRACLKRIEAAHPTLGAHLATTVRTGYFCSYNPDPRVRIVWRT